MRRIMLVGLILLAWPLNANAGQFVGTLKFMPDGCEAIRDRHLVYDFGYIDSNGVGWESSANDKTDGATIPSWAQGVIGTPFEADFIRAAVIHDHYCDRNVRTWRETHWVLYDALLAGGVSAIKAKVMYYGVLIGGPKWVTLIPGEPCKVGQMCIKHIETGITIPNSKLLTREGGIKVALRESIYNQLDLKPNLMRPEPLLRRLEIPCRRNKSMRWRRQSIQMIFSSQTVMPLDLRALPQNSLSSDLTMTEVVSRPRVLSRQGVQASRAV
jgi:Protein of unknown function (DUF1353)